MPLTFKLHLLNDELQDLPFSFWCLLNLVHLLQKISFPCTCRTRKFLFASLPHASTRDKCVKIRLALALCWTYSGARKKKKKGLCTDACLWVLYGKTSRDFCVG